MQLTKVFISFLFASVVSAKDHGNSTSTKSQCKQIFKLTSITNLAANDTKLAQHFDNNQTAIDAFKSKAAEAQTKLTGLSSNSTLMDECASIQAHSEQVKACGQIKRAEYMVALAANETALQAKFDVRYWKLRCCNISWVLADKTLCRATLQRSMLSKPKPPTSKARSLACKATRPSRPFAPFSRI